MMPLDHAMMLSAMLAVGFAVGVLYFLGLWLTVNRLAGSRSPAGKLACSYIIRLGLLMAIFYFFMHNDWQRIIALAAGFWAARFLMVRRLGAAPHTPGKRS
jgi:F1F0 ATPase subunit 2